MKAVSDKRRIDVTSFVRVSLISLYIYNSASAVQVPGEKLPPEPMLVL